MKAFTIRQPWASLAARGHKTLLDQARPTDYRGRILIHAGAHQPADGVVVGDWCVTRSPIMHLPMLQHYGSGVEHAPADIDLPLGAIVGSAIITDCLPITEYDTTEFDGTQRAFTLTRDGAVELWRTRPPSTLGGPPVNITDQLPLGNFTPGRCAWVLVDAKPTTERCPACWGGWEPPARTGPGGCSLPRCSTCDGASICDPIRAKGRSGLWTWDGAS